MIQRNEIIALREEARRKNIKNKDISKYLEVSETHVSLWFNLKRNMSVSKETSAKLFINSKDEFEYKVVKVKVN